MKSRPRFGRLALENGFITAKQLSEVLHEQKSQSKSAHKPFRKQIGVIFFEKGWMNSKQIEVVLKELFYTDTHDLSKPGT